MNKDIYRPYIIQASAPADNRQPMKVPRSAEERCRIKWSRIIKLSLLLGVLNGGLILLSKFITPQVVTALSILIGFFVLRFIVRTMLQITFTLLRYLFWIIVLAVILLLVL